MKNHLTISLAVLIGFTLLTSLAFYVHPEFIKFLPLLIMSISGAKFYLVAFEYMELRKAHIFWKTATILICLLIISIVGIFAIP
ncbi:cytochrome C oxidase subunit IV family protein [Algoriphagus persicinus]|uniref:cytochrome C oxidase subunit IV family protein n=1 Tax=Algoriphagus persicinus TaxID=3108754 RepID=UPI002B3B205C|nr:cytochrome C oxidase subunit IV family protein [Algoriphagus sp. E1-3-M2]MEB2787008.1 cytochrome C oxidase subunit IV family protein [Algoriphagus sp. E1-3-M2]